MKPLPVASGGVRPGAEDTSKTAARDLDDLVAKGVFELCGKRLPTALHLHREGLAGAAPEFDRLASQLSTHDAADSRSRHR